MPAPFASPDGDYLFHLYLRDIGRVQVLTREEETELVEQMQRGDDQAREQLLRSKLPLVVKIARDHEGYGLPLLDLISEGNLGLMKALDRFDPSRGARLATYAAWRIRLNIRRALVNQVRTVRVPVSTVGRILHLRRAALSLSEFLGREPTDAEVSAEVSLPEAEVRKLRTLSLRAVSLDEPLQGVDGGVLAERIPDPHAIPPSQAAEDESANGMLHDVLARLSPSEKAVLWHRFGLDDNGERTLAEVGQRLGMTREWARLTQKRALERMRKIIQAREKLIYKPRPQLSRRRS